MEGNYSLADVAAATRGANDYDSMGAGGWWVIILFALIFGYGNNGFGGRGGYPYGEPVTEAGLCNSMNFNNLEDASVTATAVTAGNYTVKLIADGVEIPGANQTVTAAADSVISFNIPAILRIACCKSSSNITLQISTTATLPVTITVNNGGVVVEKI